MGRFPRRDSVGFTGPRRTWRIVFSQTPEDQAIRFEKGQSAWPFVAYNETRPAYAGSPSDAFAVHPTYQPMQRSEPVEEYVLSCCSTVDIDANMLDSRNIRWLPFHFELDGVEYPDDFGKSLSYDAFYKAMANGSSTKTSQVNVDQYLHLFESILETGKDVLHIAFSSGLSGSANSAQIAAQMMAEKYPQRRVVVIDSLAASSGYGLLVQKAADLRDAGMGLDELAAWLTRNRLRVQHWFFSTDLHFYVLGGRISKAAGLVGTALKICPLLNVDSQGKLAPREKIRTKKKAIARTLDMMKEHAENGTDYQGKAYICNSACPEDAQELAKMIEAAFPKLDGPVRIFSIGTTIGSHTGPGTVALFFWGDERTD